MIRIYEKETNLQSCCWLKVAAGTTGKHGGDRGHGCLTVIEIINDNCDFGVEILKKDGVKNGVRIVMGGDQELDAITEAIEFILAKLKPEAKKDYYEPTRINNP